MNKLTQALALLKLAAQLEDVDITTTITTKIKPIIKFNMKDGSVLTAEQLATELGEQ